MTAYKPTAADVKQLRGLLPICAYCKKIRDDQDYWHQVDAYLRQHTDVRFSHAICPECFERVVQPQLNQLRQSLERETDRPKS